MRLGEVELTRIGLGTNRLRNTPQNQAFVREAIAAGVNFIDTARLYTDGESEQTLGSSAHGDGVIVATKGGYRTGRPDALRAELEQSFAQLQTTTIDLYYLHRADLDTPLEESLAAIKEYVDAGRVAHVGISAVSVEQIERARQILDVAAVQNHYNLVERASEDVVDYCTEHQILFVPYFPLRDQSAPRLAEIAERHRATRSQIVLAWLLKRSPVVAPIPGTLSIDHLRENLAALELELSDEEFQALA